MKLVFERYQLFPDCDMTDWHISEWLHNGVCALVETDGKLGRAVLPTPTQNSFRYTQPGL